MLPPEEFTKTYGTGARWSKTQSYHLYILNGHPLFRIWNNTNAEYTWVDISDSCIDPSSYNFKNIPSGNLRKCKPFTKRFAAYNKEQIVKLCNRVKQIYGLED
jgi:hypothetical protein